MGISYGASGHAQIGIFVDPEGISLGADLQISAGLLAGSLDINASHEIRVLDFSEESNQCFPAGTPISLWNGSNKPIEEITVEDVVVSYDADNNLVPGRVSNLQHNTTQEFVRLTFEDGRDDLVATPGHHFLSETGDFMEIGHMIQLGGGTVRLTDIDGSIVEASGELLVYSSQTAHLFGQSETKAFITAGNAAIEEEVEQGWATYNFEVSDHHTYVAAGIRVHNDSVLIYLEPHERITNIDFEDTGRPVSYDATTDNGGGRVHVTTTEITGTNTTEVNKFYVFDGGSGRIQIVQEDIFERDPETGENTLVSTEIHHADLDGQRIGEDIGAALTPFLTRALIGEDG